MFNRIKDKLRCVKTAKPKPIGPKATKTSPLLEDFLTASDPNDAKAPDIMDMDQETVAHFDKKAYTSSSSTCAFCLFNKEKEVSFKPDNVSYNFDFETELRNLKGDDDSAYQPLPTL